MATVRTAAQKAPSPAKLPKLSFRAFLEDAAFCGLDLSPTVAAIADASEGYAVTLSDAECIAVFGCVASALPREPRRTVCVSAGGRGGKSSRLLAPKALHAAWTVPLPDIRARERGRSVIIAPDKDLADQDLDYVRGYAEESEVLRRYLVPAPKTCVRLRRVDGTIVDIRVGAATRGGKAARARALVGCFLDESAFFFPAGVGVVNDKEIYRAAIQRVVPGGQVWIVTTPWIEEEGLLEEKIKGETGADGMRRHESALIVSRVGTRSLNPRWDHTEECGKLGACTKNCGEIERDMRADDPENAAREIDAIPLSAGTTAFFPPEVIAKCFDLQAFAGPRVGVGCGADFGFTSDCTGGALVGKYAGGFDWFDAHEQRPTRDKPLVPSVAVGNTAQWARSGGARAIACDGHYKETAREHVVAAGLQFVEGPEGPDGKVLTYTALRKEMAEGRFRISVPDPLLRERIRTQLRSITKKALPAGGIQISAPRRKNGPQGGTTHGDLVSGGVLAAWKVGAGRSARSASASEGIPCGQSRWARVVEKRQRGRSDVAQE